MKKVFKTMAFTLLGLVLSSNLWAAVTAVSASGIESGKSYVIVATYSNDDYLLKPTTFSAKNSTAASFDASKVSASDAWLFTKSGDTWTIKLSTGEGLYFTNDNNGVACAENKGASFSIAATTAGATTSYLTASDGTNTRYLALYQSSNWRCYKSTSSGVPTIQLYSISTTPTPPADPFTVTLKDTETALTETSAGAGVTLPSRTTTCTDYTFAGWSETNCTSETTTAPTIIEAGEYKPTKNIDLYPVFTRTVAGGGEPQVDVIDNAATATSTSGKGTSAWATDFDVTKNATYTIHTMGLNSGMALRWNTNGFLETKTPAGANIQNVTASGTRSKSIKIFAKNVGDADYTSIATLNLSGENNDISYDFKATENYTHIKIIGGSSATDIKKITITYGAASTTYYITTPQCDPSAPSIAASAVAFGTTFAVTGSEQITVMGANLSNAIVASIKEENTIYSTEGTLTAEGGTLTVKYDATGKEAGQYDATLVLTSGETSVEYAITLTLKTYTTCAQANSLVKDATATLGAFDVVYVNGNYIYIKDNTGSTLLYINNYGLVARDHVAAGMEVKGNPYYGLPEAIPTTAFSALEVTHNAFTPTPEALSAAPTAADVNKYVKLENVKANETTTFTTSSSSDQTTVKFDNTDVTVRNGFKQALSFASGTYYDMIGTVARYNSTIQIYPISIEEKEATKYAITFKEPINNGSASIDAEGNEAVAGATITITTNPADGYKDGTITVVANDETPIEVTNKQFEMPAQPVTITVTFVEKAKYAITWKDRGNNTQTNVTEGEGLVLPENPTAPIGWEFVGWTAIEGYSHETDAPAFAKNGDAVSGLATYYAVFAVADKKADGATETLNVGTYASNHSWENTKAYTTAETDNVTFTGNSGVGNNAKYYSSDNSWRFYKATSSAEAGLLTIATKQGQILSKIVIGASSDGFYIPEDWEWEEEQKYYYPEDGVEQSSVEFEIDDANTNITSITVTFGDAYDYSNYTTNPTEQVKIHFDLNGGSGTFNDVSIDKGSDYTVTSATPTPATGYEFIGWLYNEVTYSEGQTISNIQTNITLTAQYKKAWYTVADASTSTEGSVTITTLTEGKAEFEATVTLTPQAKTGFAFSAIEAYKTGEDATKIELTPGAENTYTFSMPAYAVTVKATFIEAASACDINFYVAGALAETASATRGQEYSITQTGATFDGFTFVGWATQEYATEQEEAIITITSVTPPTGSEDPINLYAVYRRSDASTANLVISNPDSWVGKYLVVFSDNKPHSAIKVGSSSKDDFIAADGAPELVISEGIITMTDALTDYAIRVANGTATGTYTLQLPNNKYLYIPNANGMCSKADATDLYLNYYSSEKQEGVQVSNDGNFNTESRILYENNTNWRCYTNKINSASYGLPAFYKITEGQSYYTTSPVVKYTISYDLNGGEKGEGNFEAQQVVKGETATLTTSVPVAPIGYKFDGWYNGDVKVGETIENVQNDIELVAHYNILSYEVTTPIVDNGTIEVATLTEGKAAYNTELTITLTPATDFEVVPNSLKVYETGNEENVVPVTENKFAMPAFPVTVAAAFQALTPNFTITVQSANTDQGTVSIFGETETSLSLKEGDERTILAYPKKGYYFVNWTTSDDITITDADQEVATFTVKTSDATITANFEAIPSVTYTLVTDVKQLAAGDIVVFGSTYTGGTDASKKGSFVNGVLGDNKYLASVSATIDEEKLTATGACEFTLAGGEGSWMLTSSEGQLGATAVKANLTTKTTAENYVGTWTIAIDETTYNATIKSTNENYGSMSYNGSSPRFANYSSVQNAIQLYKKEQTSEVVRTGLTSGKYGTICLNKEVTDFEGAEFYSIVGYQGDQSNPTGIVIESVEDNLVAGMPYIFKATASQITVTYTGEQAVTAPVTDDDKTAANGLIGSFVETKLNAGYYGIQNNALVMVVDADVWVDANRAYIDMEYMSSAADAPAPAPGVRRVAMSNSSYSAPTDLNTLNSNVKVQKVMKDGQLYIIRDTKMYNAQGQLVK